MIPWSNVSLISYSRAKYFLVDSEGGPVIFKRDFHQLANLNSEGFLGGRVDKQFDARQKEGWVNGYLLVY